MIETLRRLRDVGNYGHCGGARRGDHSPRPITSSRLGPGPGVHGGRIAAEGTIRQILKNPRLSKPASFSRAVSALTCRLSAARSSGCNLHVRGCPAPTTSTTSSTSKSPWGSSFCVTWGRSGSGKSTLVHDILYKKLYSIFHDSRVLSGAHDRLDGIEHISNVINIDPISHRSPRPAPTQLRTSGFYDNIRRLFAPDARGQEGAAIRPRALASTSREAAARNAAARARSLPSYI